MKNRTIPPNSRKHIFKLGTSVGKYLEKNTIPKYIKNESPAYIPYVINIPNAFLVEEEPGYKFNPYELPNAANAACYLTVN